MTYDTTLYLASKDRRGVPSFEINCVIIFARPVGNYRSDSLFDREAQCVCKSKSQVDIVEIKELEDQKSSILPTLETILKNSFGPFPICSKNHRLLYGIYGIFAVTRRNIWLFLRIFLGARLSSGLTVRVSRSLSHSRVNWEIESGFTATRRHGVSRTFLPATKGQRGRETKISSAF